MKTSKKTEFFFLLVLLYLFSGNNSYRLSLSKTGTHGQKGKFSLTTHKLRVETAFVVIQCL